MTETDIPPGGEGKIEVTFNSAHKKGKQNKTVTVTSNDPRNPSKKITITVLVEVEFGFAPSSLGFGQVNHDQTVTKSAKILVKDPSHTQLKSLKTSSDFISAKVNSQGDGDVSSGSITLEITLDPGLPPGRINEFVTATSTNPAVPEARLRIGGNIIGDVEVNPGVVRFVIQAKDSSRATSIERKISITNHSDDRPLEIIDVSDPYDRLILKLKTVEPGQRFELLVSLKDQKSTGKNLGGSIVILTNNPSQKKLTVGYTINYRK